MAVIQQYFIQLETTEHLNIWWNKLRLKLGLGCKLVGKLVQTGDLKKYFHLESFFPFPVYFFDTFFPFFPKLFNSFIFKSEINGTILTCLLERS